MALVPKEVKNLTTKTLYADDFLQFNGDYITLLPGATVDLLTIAADEDVAKSRWLGYMETAGLIQVISTFDTANTHASTPSTTTASADLTDVEGNVNVADGLVKLNGSGDMPAIDGSAITSMTKAQVGLGSVDNTSDANKPVSTAQGMAIGLKEDAANKDAVSGYAGLDGSSKIASAQMSEVLASSDLTDLSGAVNSANGAVRLDSSGNLPAINGSALTNLPASASRVTITKYTVSESAFTAAATTEDIELFSLPAGHAIRNISMKHSVSFTGGSLSAWDFGIGNSGNLNAYFPPPGHNAFQAVSGSAFGANFLTGVVASLASYSAATSIRLAATAAGDNVVNATAGSIDIWVETVDMIS